MSFENINPSQAGELLDRDEGYTYVDVRSIPEFENGHPTGAVNIPLMHHEQDQMVPNPEFLRLVEVNFAKDARLIIGCQSGARSLRAVEALTASGFTQILHMDGGFGGSRNEMGQVIEKGWMELGLPIEYGTGEGQSYTSLGGKK
jgi:rhodanese-related sulfurtransferase